MAALYPSRIASDLGHGLGKHVSFAMRFASSGFGFNFRSSSTGRNASNPTNSSSNNANLNTRRRDQKGASTSTVRNNNLGSKSSSSPSSVPPRPPRAKTRRNTSAPLTRRRSTMARSTLTSAPASQSQSMPYLEEQLFAFSKIPLGDFESIMAWVETHQAVDLQACREKMLWQTYKTFERLLKRDFEERHLRLVQEFTNQCVQTYAILDYGADCGYENLRKYIRNLVLTPDMARMNYLARMMRLPPHERLECITRPVPGHLEKLKWFCLLYDHLYEKVEQEARHRMERTLLNRFQTRLETVQARLSRGTGTLLSSPEVEVGRAF